MSVCEHYCQTSKFETESVFVWSETFTGVAGTVCGVKATSFVTCRVRTTPIQYNLYLVSKPKPFRLRNDSKTGFCWEKTDFLNLRVILLNLDTQRSFFHTTDTTQTLDTTWVKFWGLLSRKNGVIWEMTIMLQNQHISDF